MAFHSTIGLSQKDGKRTYILMAFNAFNHCTPGQKQVNELFTNAAAAVTIVMRFVQTTNLNIIHSLLKLTILSISRQLKINQKLQQQHTKPKSKKEKEREKTTAHKQNECYLKRRKTGVLNVHRLKIDRSQFL